MGMFSNLLHAILGHAAPATAAPTPAPEASTPAAPASDAPAVASNNPGPASGAAATAAPVDMTSILDGLAAKSSEDLDWRKSIVDLLKLVGMDSSLSARKELASDLHYTGDTSDSASMNVWLHKAVMQKLSENGGKVPAELL